MVPLSFPVLDKDQLKVRLSELRAVDTDLPWMLWHDDAYLMDLPRKWELSRLAESNGVIVGYALCSEKESGVWLHRIVVNADRRQGGVGKALLREIERSAQEGGYKSVSLKTPVNNVGARRFYRSGGYEEKAWEEGEYVEMTKDLKAPVVGVHQPNFLPWLGYFYKMSRSDVFVILDDVLAPSRGYFNRSKVLVQGEGRWLTVPVHRNDGYIHRMTMAGDEWVAKHVATLQHVYRHAPFFQEVMPGLKEIFHSHSRGRLAELNEALIVHVASMLEITTPCVRSSDYALESSGDERLVDLVLSVGGSRYLSGQGGDNYQHPETFEAANVGLLYTGFESQPYSQHNVNEFIPGLSVVDALFNLGPRATRGLLDAAPDPR